MIQNALFRQCLAAIPEEQKAEFELKFRIAERSLSYLKIMVRGTKMGQKRAKKRKRLHDDVLHISKKPLRGELNGFLSICQAEASCISPKEY